MFQFFNSPVERRFECLKLATEICVSPTCTIDDARVLAVAAELDAFLIGEASADVLQDALERIVAAGTRDLNEGIQGRAQPLTSKTLSPEAQIARAALAKLQRA